jgi:Fe-S-cluster containining protein
MSAEPQDDVTMVEPLASLERQLERDSIRSQAIFNRSFERLSELEQLLLGLIDALVARGVVSEHEVEPAARAVADELAERAEELPHRVILRDDTAEQAARPEAFVDCAARMPVCRAVCCKLSVQLSAEEVEAGKVHWDLGRPYLLRREEDGRCTHQDRSSGFCGVYADRPRPCRQYSCANDRRIWRDFEGMVLNTEWLDTHLAADEPQLIQLEPLRQSG